jgi:hypothetical protein
MGGCQLLVVGVLSKTVWAVTGAGARGAGLRMSVPCFATCPQMPACQGPAACLA